MSAKFLVVEPYVDRKFDVSGAINMLGVHSPKERLELESPLTGMLNEYCATKQLLSETENLPDQLSENKRVEMQVRDLLAALKNLNMQARWCSEDDLDQGISKLAFRYQRTIADLEELRLLFQRASSLPEGSKRHAGHPPNHDFNMLVMDLCRLWRDLKGKWPGITRPYYRKGSSQKVPGPFSRLVIAALRAVGDVKNEEQVAEAAIDQLIQLKNSAS